MSLKDHLNQYTQKEWSHCIPKGITIVTLNLNTLHKIPDPLSRTDSKGKIIHYSCVETYNHYHEAYQRKGMAQPKESRLRFGKKVIVLLVNLINKHYDGVEPVQLDVMIRRYDHGSQKLYQILATDNKKSFEQAIDLLNSNHFKELHSLFNEKINKKWFKV